MNKEFKKKKDSKTSSSILVGVLVCFVLIAVYGIVTQLNVSYALPETLKEIENVKEVKPSLVNGKTTGFPDQNYPPVVIAAPYTTKDVRDLFKMMAGINQTVEL